MNPYIKTVHWRMRGSRESINIVEQSQQVSRECCKDGYSRERGETYGYASEIMTVNGHGGTGWLTEVEQQYYFQQFESKDGVCVVEEWSTGSIRGEQRDEILARSVSSYIMDAKPKI